MIQVKPPPVPNRVEPVLGHVLMLSRRYIPSCVDLCSNTIENIC